MMRDPAWAGFTEELKLHEQRLASMDSSNQGNDVIVSVVQSWLERSRGYSGPSRQQQVYSFSDGTVSLLSSYRYRETDK